MIHFAEINENADGMWYTVFIKMLEVTYVLEDLRNHLKSNLKILPILLRWLAIAVFLGLFIGAVGTVFHLGIEKATELRIRNPWLLYILPFGGVIIAFIYKISGLEKDRGTNGVLSAVRENTDLSGKIAPSIFFGTIVTHLFGGSSGREGAALQIGGSIGSLLGRLLKLDEKDARIITMCGMSAAFSALFGTPITSVIFSMEVISVGIMHYSAIVPCVISALVGTGVASHFGIAPTHFIVYGIPTLNFATGCRVLILGILCATVSVLFCWALNKSGQLYASKIKNSLVRAFAGGILVILITLLFGTRDYNGAGMDVIARALSGTARPEAFLLKMLLTAVTLGAGFKGGEIVPSFFVGATFGNVVGSLIGLDPSFAAAIGLLAVFCGVTNCPITSLMLSIEMFGMDGLVFYAIACAVSYMLSGHFGLYKEQKIMYSKIRPEFIDTKAM